MNFKSFGSGLWDGNGNIDGNSILIFNLIIEYHQRQLPSCLDNQHNHHHLTLEDFFLCSNLIHLNSGSNPTGISNTKSSINNNNNHSLGFMSGVSSDLKQNVSFFLNFIYNHILLMHLTNQLIQNLLGSILIWSLKKSVFNIQNFFLNFKKDFGLSSLSKFNVECLR